MHGDYMEADGIEYRLYVDEQFFVVLEPAHLRRGYKIGRAPENDLALDNDSIADHHATLKLVAGDVYLTDHRSTNKTYRADGRPLTAYVPHKLENNETFKIQPRTLRFEVIVQDHTTTQQIPPVQELPARAEDEPPGFPTSTPGSEREKQPSRMVDWPIDPHPEVPGRYLSELPSLFAQHRSTLGIQQHDRLPGSTSPESGFLACYLKIFEAIWEPIEQRQDHLERYFDPYICPDEFLVLLGAWLGVEFEPDTPPAQQRLVLINTTRLHELRGTLHGLYEAIRCYTGLESHVYENPQDPFIVHIDIYSVNSRAIRRESIESIIRRYKPAHVAYSLSIRER
jgi:phage tail-like protein